MALPEFVYSPPLCSWHAVAPAPAFYSWRRVFPFLEPLLAFRGAILEEALAVGRSGGGSGASSSSGDTTTTGSSSSSSCGAAAAAAPASGGRWFDWPETTLYDAAGGASWRVLPFCHTFPASDASKTAWLAPAAAACPQTAALLRRIPGLRTALFSRMGPGTVLEPHAGWADLSNHVLRVHMPLLVPGEEEAAAAAAAGGGGGGARSCGVAVGEEVHFHRTGEFIVFDDSKMHSAFNSHATGERLVLIFDLARPPGLPPGQATGATTDELQGFINYFK